MYRNMLHLGEDLLLSSVVSCGEDAVGQYKEVFLLHSKVGCYPLHGIFHPENLCAVLKKDTASLHAYFKYSVNIDISSCLHMYSKRNVKQRIEGCHQKERGKGATLFLKPDKAGPSIVQIQKR